MGDIFENINTTDQLKDDREEQMRIETFALGRMRFLAGSYRALPVYLVDARLIDLIAPPTRTRHEKREKRERNKFAERLELSERETVAVAVYVPGSAKNGGREKFPPELQRLSFPAIFICPERVRAITRRYIQVAGIPTGSGIGFGFGGIGLGVQALSHRSPEPYFFGLVFSLYLLHELVHAETDRERGSREVSEVERNAEESIANAVAFTLLSEPEERAVAHMIMSAQPWPYGDYVRWLGRCSRQPRRGRPLLTKALSNP